MVSTKAYTNAYTRSTATAPDSPTSRTNSSSGTSNSSPRPTTPPSWANAALSPGSVSSSYDGDFSVTALMDSPNSQATSVKSAPEALRKEMIADFRARGARMRSQTMLENLIMGGDIQINKTLCFSSEAKDNQPLTVRQAATRRSETTERQTALVKAELKNFKSAGIGLAGLSLHPRPQTSQKLAETTRRPRALTPDDVMDPESISGMKCQMDWDRQKWAEKRALSLLESGGAFY